MARVMISRYKGRCTTCAGAFDAGTEIAYDGATKSAAHVVCPAVPLAFVSTPVAAVEAEIAALGVFEDAASRARANALAVALTIERGAVVRVVRGRKVPLGTVGDVIWVGFGRYGARVGVKDADGVVHWTARSNVALEAVNVLMPAPPALAVAA